MSKFPSKEEFDVYLAMQKKAETAITWEELPTNKMYRVIPVQAEVKSGIRCKLLNVVDAEEQKTYVWTPVDIYDHLTKFGLKCYFRLLEGKKRKTYESVHLSSGKRKCLVHSKSDALINRVRKNIHIGAAKQRKIEKKAEETPEN